MRREGEIENWQLTAKDIGHEGSIKGPKGIKFKCGRQNSDNDFVCQSFINDFPRRQFLIRPTSSLKFGKKADKSGWVGLRSNDSHFFYEENSPVFKNPK